MSSLPDNLTLGDVGMESILAVEMQQRIEREYEVKLTTDEIKLLTVGQIKQYQTGKTRIFIFELFNDLKIKQFPLHFQMTKRRSKRKYLLLKTV